MLPYHVWQTIITFCYAFGTWHSWRHLLKSLVRRLTTASPPSCRTPPVMLSSLLDLLWSSFFIKASTSADRMMGGASSVANLCDCCGSIVSICSFLYLHSSWKNSTQHVTMWSLLRIRVPSSSMMDMSCVLPRYCLCLACFRLLFFSMALTTCFAAKGRMSSFIPCLMALQVWTYSRLYEVVLPLFITLLFSCGIFILVNSLSGFSPWCLPATRRAT